MRTADSNVVRTTLCAGLCGIASCRTMRMGRCSKRICNILVPFKYIGSLVLLLRSSKLARLILSDHSRQTRFAFTRLSPAPLLSRYLVGIATSVRVPIAICYLSVHAAQEAMSVALTGRKIQCAARLVG